MEVKDTKIEHCKLIQLPKIHNALGNITAIENSKDIPFVVFP